MLRKRPTVSPPCKEEFRVSVSPFTMILSFTPQISRSTDRSKTCHGLILQHDECLTFAIQNNHTGQAIHFKSRPSTPAERAFEACFTMMNLTRDECRFLIDGEQVDRLDDLGTSVNSAGIRNYTVMIVDRLQSINLIGRSPCFLQLGSGNNTARYYNAYPEGPDLWHHSNNVLDRSKDSSSAEDWDTDNTLFFKVHLLSIATFTNITGLKLLPSQISDSTYNNLGYAYRDSYKKVAVVDKELPFRRTGRTQEAGLRAGAGTVGTKERRTFVPDQVRLTLAMDGDVVGSVETRT
ncbi:hypothetical protein VTL71DRAFT_11393 [Oculimacula yallundae]|uniref:Uncharacterized protein n=1 Tax=Oculimacula yallundae TaxID=86028 RepID=A0ABR4CQ12_9HELO